jgi:ribosome-associated heat shock protein Hsp15
MAYTLTLIIIKSISLEFDYYNLYYMRLDKYLWSIRFFKTRSIATDYCKKGHIKMNDQSCKPSKEVYLNDLFLIRKNQINYKIQVLGIPESRVGAKLLYLYIKDLTPVEEFQKNELLKYSKDYYRKKGTGRPTKKDRRDIDDYQNASS